VFGRISEVFFVLGWIRNGGGTGAGIRRLPLREEISPPLHIPQEEPQEEGKLSTSLNTFIHCSGSISFWAIRNPLVRGTDPDPPIIKQK